MISETVDVVVGNAFAGESEEKDLNLLEDKLNEIFGYQIDLNGIKGKSAEEVSNLIYDDLIKIYDEKEKAVGDEVFRKIERYIMLEVLDSKWRQHLKDLTELREGIRLRSYGQRNPIHDYKIVGYDIYNEMIDAIKRETSSFILKLKVRGEEDTNNLTHEEVSNVKYEHTDDKIIIGDDYQQEVIPEKLEQPQRPLSRRERRERERRNI